MNLDQIEKLTADFYEWERRGRGWDVWQFPVELEPPFIPFYYHYVQRAAPVDDGRKPTFLSKIADTFMGSASQEVVQSVPSQDQYDSLLPNAFENTEKIIELKVSLPKDYKISSDYMRQCLLNITFGNLPVSFEIVGSKDTITVQFACRTPDISHVKSQIQAYFPESVISESDTSLDFLNDPYKKTFVVDFGLSEEFMRPLRTYKSFDPDPLTGVFGVMDDLKSDETGIVQILFQAANAPWVDSMMRAVIDGNGDSFFADAPEMVSLTKDKLKDPLFAVVARIAGQCATEERALQIFKSLAGCFSVFADPQSNEFIPLKNDDYDDEEHIRDVILRRSHRGGMLLNGSELISLVHFPSASVVAQKLHSLKQKSMKVPVIATQNEFILGENIHNGIKTIVSLNQEQRLRHMHVVGATGTGKSTMLLNLIIQDIQKGIGVAVLDPHGDLIESVLDHIPENRHDDVILFDPGNEEYSIGFNILEATSEVEKNVLASDLVEIFRRFSTSWGDQMSVVLGNAISAFLESEEKGSLIDLRKFLIEKEYRAAFLRKVHDEHVTYFWEKEFPLLRGAALSSILTRLDFFLRPKLIRNIVSQKEGIDLENIVNNKKILLIKLAQGIIGDENAYLLGSLIVSKLHQVVMQRQLQSSSERKPFYLYIDEFQNFITPSMKSILSGARKYNLGLILAHQDLHQLWETDMALANSVITNAGTRICFRIGDFDAQKLQGGFAHFDTSDLQNLSIGEAVVRIERSDHDFNIRTFLPSAVDAQAGQENRRKIIELSQRKYGNVFPDTKKESIEQVSPPPSKPPVKKEVSKKEVAVTPHTDLPKVSSQNIEQKGVSYHRYLQTLIKRMAEQRGFKAIIEESILDGKGRVDVGLERGTEKIACEISVTTKDEHELQNIEKCFRAGYQKILICTPEKKRIESLKKLISEKLELAQSEHIFLMLPDELYLFFEQQIKERPRQGTEKIVKGYRVKIEYNDISDAEKKQKHNTIGEVIAQSLRRLKK
jgi:DNA helicase HerA-like ATPase